MNFAGQNLGTWINQRANPAVVAIMCYFGIAFSFLIDLLIFKLGFTGLEIVGACTCLLFSLLAAVYKHYWLEP